MTRPSIWRTLVTECSRLLRDGAALFRLAPWVVALVVVPEFLQHVAEIQIGMFDSLEQARALSADPRRMVFGYAKVAGLSLAIIAAVRFWGVRARGETFWRGRWRPLRAIVAFAAFLLIPLAAEPLRPVMPQVAPVIGLALSILTLPLVHVFVAALAGEPDVTLRQAYTAGWRSLVVLLVLLVLAFAPAQALHMLLHHLALDAPRALIWGLMIVDALVVGLLAALVGTAFWRGYAAFFRTDEVATRA